MPSIIDQFIVELGLDPAKFKENEKAAAADLLLLKYRSEDTVRKVETAYKRIVDGFESVGRKALGFISLVLGGVSLVGFAKEIVQLDKNLGIMSDLTGETVENLNRWRNTFQRLGGTPEGISNTIKGIKNEMNAMSAGAPATSSSLVSVLNALHNYDPSVNIQPMKNGKWKTPTEILTELNEVLPKMKGVRTSILNQLKMLPGIDDATAVILMRGDLKKELEEQDKIGKVSDANRTAADRLWGSWYKMAQVAEQLGNNMVTWVANPVVNFFDRWTEIMQEFDKGIFISPNSLLGRLMNLDKDGRLPVRATTPSLSDTGDVSGTGAGTGGDLPKTNDDGDAKWNYMKGQHGAPGENLTQIDTAYGKLTVNKHSADAFKGFYDDAAAMGVPIKTIGSYNYRQKAFGLPGWSQHAYGNATDMDNQIPLSPAMQKWVTEHPKEWGGLLQKHGMKWNPGGRDPGHIEWGGTSAKNIGLPIRAGMPLPFMLTPGNLGAMNGGRVINNTTKNDTTKTDVGSLTVNSQASDPVGIAGDIMDALRSQASPGMPQ